MRLLTTALRKRVISFITILGIISRQAFSLVNSFPLISTSVLTSRRDLLLLNTLAVISMTMTAAPAESDDGENIKWGIVGLGDVCQVKSGPAFWKCNGSTLSAVMRRTRGKAKEFANNVVPKENGCVGYEDIDQFLKHEGLEAVYVATRPGSHLEICSKVAAAGKACYVEKPVGRCAEETQVIADIFQEAGLPLYTAYISRAYDRTQALRDLLMAGGKCPIGDRLTKISYTLVGTGGARDIGGDLPWRLDAQQSGGGLIMDVGCHVLDRLDYLCGPLITIKGKAENRHSPGQLVEDYIQLTGKIGPSRSSSKDMIIREGADFECTWDFASPDKQPVDSLIFEGPTGSLRMTGMSPSAPIEILNSSGKLVKTLEFEMPDHTAQKLIQATTNDLLLARKKSSESKPEQPDFLSLGDNAIRTQEVLDKVLNDYYGGRETGYWSRMKN